VIDFKSINTAALPRLGDLLPRWLPGGRAEAGEYVCASLEGGQGRSCSVNLGTGAWGDFATDAKGGDPISLWAAIRGIKQGEAARELARDLGLEADRAARNNRRRVVAAYDYLGPDGKLVFQVTRWQPKTFTQRRPDGNGGWINSVKGIVLVPYRLPQIIQAKAVFIVEGEKDAEALAALGLAATCNAQGAGKWRAEYNRHFAGKRVCILPDNDDPGRKHARDVARQLHGLTEVVKVIELPGLPPKGDVSDWLAAGGTRESLLEMVKAAPVWEPTAELQDTEDHEGRRQGDEDAILIREGALAEAVDAAEEILARPDLPLQFRIFQRGSQLVRVAVLPGSGFVEGVTRPQGATVIIPLDKAFILDVLSRFATFKKWDARKKALRVVDAPKALAEAIIARIGLWRFPVLRGVISCPTIRGDGSLLLDAGFDEASGYYVAHSLKPQVPHNPSQTDAKAALNVLADLLTGFSFVEPVDYSVALTLIITAVVRSACDTVPIVIITAPVRGSGKSTIMEITSLISTGRRCVVLSATSDPVEREKRLGGCLLSGDQLINIDNHNGVLNSDLLCQASTSETLKVRPLGTSAQSEIPNTSLWCANGNNISVGGDLARRTLMCRLDPGCERPEDRVFEFDPVARALERRAEYVAAALTVVRAYVVAGKPDVGLSPFGSFEKWSTLVRAALVWVGACDPCESREAVMDDDPEGATLRALLAAWTERFGRTPRTVREIINAANEDDSPLGDVIQDIAGEGRGVNAKRLGWWLRRQLGRIVDGMKLTQERVSRVANWKVVPVNSQ
jgi:putative DNA primase/helicase